MPHGSPRRHSSPNVSESHVGGCRVADISLKTEPITEMTFFVNGGYGERVSARLEQARRGGSEPRVMEQIAEIIKRYFADAAQIKCGKGFSC